MQELRLLRLRLSQLQRYSEFVVLDTLWPDFDEREIMKTVEAFYKRKRRFGGLDKEEKK